jgi:hypothetical protein
VNQSAPELNRPFMVSPSETLLAASLREQLIDDVTQIIQRVRFVEVAPTRLWEPGLVSEFAEAVDKLAVKVAKLQEAQGADR